MTKKQRLQKIIGNAGVLSRRKAEEAILSGRVSINGVAVTELGISINPAIDSIEIDGVKINVAPTLVTFAFYKPKKVISSKFDPQGRPTVMEYFVDFSELNPVGRLDFDSEGLMVVTNDGELHHRLTHPSFGITKNYEVVIREQIDLEEVKMLENKIHLIDGPGRFDEVTITEINSNSTTLNVQVSEGRNRFIRRMFDAIDKEVIKLKRTGIGDYVLGDLKPGARIVLHSSDILLLKSK